MRNKIFVILVFLIIIIIPIGIFFRKPKKTSIIENRALAERSSIKLNKNLNENVEEYLEDQFILGETLKKIYNSGKGKVVELSMNFIEKNSLMHKIPMGNNLFKLANSEYIVYKDDELEKYKEQYKENIDSINGLYNKHEDKQFFVYNIITDSTLENRKEYDSFIVEKLNENIKYKSSSRINNWDDYKRSFYKTDHHWSKNGQYEGYLDIAELIGIENKLEISGEKKFDVIKFYGSKVRELGTFGELYDEFIVNEYVYPEMKIEINDNEVEDYGNKDAFYQGIIPMEIGINYYADFYGTDYAKIKITVEENQGKDNILIMSNSYSNPINKLIASAYYNTYIIDLRHYETQFGKKFDIDEFILTNNISQILILGNHKYFVSKDSVIK